jgi:MFS family permease
MSASRPEPPSSALVPDGAAAVEAATAVGSTATAEPGVAGVLRLHDFRLLFIMQLATGFRGPLLFVTQAWYVNTVAPEGQRVVLLGLLAAIRGAAFLGWVFFGGAIADRFPRRPTLIVAHVIALASTLGVAALLYVPAIADGEGPWLWIMLGLFGGLGLINGQDMPTRTAMIRDAVAEEQLTLAVTLHQFAQAVPLLVVGPLAGEALERVGFATAYAAAGAGHVVVLIAAWRMHSRAGAADPDAASESMIRNLRDGLGYLRQDATVRWAIFVTWLCLAAGMSVMGILVAAWVEQILDLDASGWGVMISTWAAGTITASMWLTRQGETRRTGALFLAAAALFGLSVLGFSLSRSVPPAFLFNGLAGLSNQLVITVSMVIVQRRVPNRLLGRVMGLLLLAQGIMQLAGLGVGAAAQVVGLESVYFGAALVILGFVALVTLTQRPLRSLA